MQATEKDETIRREQQLVQDKDRELAEAQQKVSYVCVFVSVCMLVCTAHVKSCMSMYVCVL